MLCKVSGWEGVVMETVHCWHTWNVCELIGEMFVVDLTVCYNVCESVQ